MFYADVFISTIIIFILTLILAVLISSNAVRTKRAPFIFWSSGLWIFAVSVLLETIFSAGISNSILMDSYLFLVAVLVEMLALGSVYLLGNRKLMNGYVIYSVLADIILGVSLLITPLPGMIITGVVAGILPIAVVITSSIVTFPAAALLIIISYVSYRKRADKKLISIILGVIVVSVAGTLYIAAFPAFLYYAEFIGIVLLWLGFVDFSRIFASSPKENTQKNVTG
ncbi:MAG: hypothetical protein M1496_06525 [Candidatus Thermoplasmatota archaeon]|jgi:hypothetical protein|nr:hypothetical protein [Candidatus Thermoplasmatota archaeon]